MVAYTYFCNFTKLQKRQIRNLHTYCCLPFSFILIKYYSTENTNKFLQSHPYHCYIALTIALPLPLSHHGKAFSFALKRNSVQRIFHFWFGLFFFLFHFTLYYSRTFHSLNKLVHSLSEKYFFFLLPMYFRQHPFILPSLR